MIIESHVKGNFRYSLMKPYIGRKRNNLLIQVTKEAPEVIEGFVFKQMTYTGQTGNRKGKIFPIEDIFFYPAQDRGKKKIHLKNISFEYNQSHYENAPPQVHLNWIDSIDGLTSYGLPPTHTLDDTTGFKKKYLFYIDIKMCAKAKERQYNFTNVDADVKFVLHGSYYCNNIKANRILYSGNIIGYDQNDNSYFCGIGCFQAPFIKAKLFAPSKCIANITELNVTDISIQSNSQVFVNTVKSENMSVLHSQVTIVDQLHIKKELETTKGSRVTSFGKKISAHIGEDLNINNSTLIIHDKFVSGKRTFNPHKAKAFPYIKLFDWFLNVNVKNHGVILHKKSAFNDAQSIYNDNTSSILEIK